MNVTNEMVEAFCRVYWSGDWPYERTEADRQLSDLLRSKVRAGLDAALSHAAGQEVDVSNRLRPRNWTHEMDVAWHTNIPNTAKAFDALLDAARIAPAVARSEGEG